MVRGWYCFILCITLGCGQTRQSGTAQKPVGPEGGNVAVESVPNSLNFDANIPRNQLSRFNEAISILYKYRISPTAESSQKMQTMMKLSDSSPESLQKWLSQRVSHIIGSDQVDVSWQETPRKYPNADKIPMALRNADQLSLKSEETSEAHVVAQNVGVSWYLEGKFSQRLTSVQIPGDGKIEILSPRTGVIQIGPGMFMFDYESKYMVPNIRDDIFVAGILFHEARHSDGNGESVGFLHAACPPGHTYEGLLACDAALNGAYSVGSLVMKNLIDNCSDCSLRSLSILREILADQMDRLVAKEDYPGAHPGFEAGQDWDDAPEYLAGE